MKKRLILALGAMVVGTSIMAVPAYAQPQKADVKVQVNGAAIAVDTYIDNNRTLMPFRAVGEVLGAELDWKAETKTITCTLNDKTAVLRIGDTAMSLNGKYVKLDAAPVIINGSTYLPVRAIADAMGAKVNWDALTKTVIINTEEYKENILKVEKIERVDSVAFAMAQMERDIKAGNKTIVPVTAEYPVFEGNGRAATRLNQIIFDDAEGKLLNFRNNNNNKYYNMYQKYLKEGKKTEFGGYSYSVSYDVKTNSDGIVSLLITETTQTPEGYRYHLSGLTVSSKEGVVMTGNDFYDNAEEEIKGSLVADGYNRNLVNKLDINNSSFYIWDGEYKKMVYMIYLPTISEPVVYELRAKESSDDISLRAVKIESKEITDKLVSYDNSIVMRLTGRFPQFSAAGRNYSNLNKAMESRVAELMKAYGADNKAAAVKAYDDFTKVKNDVNKRFTPWLWTFSYDVKYSTNELASVVTDLYTFKGKGVEETVYTAYVCDLENGTIVNVDSLLTNPKKTDELAKEKFYKLFEAERLNFYTDVYGRFNIKKAQKYISKDGVTYMFGPGELASVSKGVIEVTVPME